MKHIIQYLTFIFFLLFDLSFFLFSFACIVQFLIEKNSNYHENEKQVKEA